MFATFSPTLARGVATCLAWRTQTTLIVSLALVLSGCKTMPAAQDESSTENSYTNNCAAGAVGGAAIALLGAVVSGKKLSAEEMLKTGARGAVVGCAIGLATTAIGKLMNKNQLSKHEEEMQKEAQRRALEQQQYTAATQRIQNLPANTPAQRTARDTELDKSRAAFQASLNQPAKVDIGDGGVSTIQVLSSTPTTGGNAATPPANQATGQTGCTDYSVFTKTAAGQARQYETWCPNSAGQMVRTGVRAAAA